MDRVDDRSPRARLDAAVDLCGVDLILECERAASRRNPRRQRPASVEQERVAKLSLRGGTRAQSPEIRPQTDGIPPSLKGAAGFSCQ